MAAYLAMSHNARACSLKLQSTKQQPTITPFFTKGEMLKTPPLLPYKDWTTAISSGLVISMQLMRIAPQQWKCQSRILDPKRGEILYEIGHWRGKQTKIMRSSGAWLKVYENYQPVDRLQYFIEPVTSKE